MNLSSKLIQKKKPTIKIRVRLNYIRLSKKVNDLDNILNLLLKNQKKKRTKITKAVT